MPVGTSLLGFIAAALVVLLLPGPGVLYVVARSVEQGYRAGLASAFGLSAGAFVHVAAATAGLSAILLASATAFGIVKALGAGYLIYLGLRTILSLQKTPGIAVSKNPSFFRIMIDGAIVSVFNPKIAIFFLAFLPQFVESDAGPVTRQVLFLGLIYVSLALLTDSIYALTAGSVRHWLGHRVMRRLLPRYVIGSLYFGLGVKTALTGRTG